MDGGKQNTEEAMTKTSVPAVSISFYLSNEDESSPVSVHEMREQLRENNQAVTRVDNSLYTLKNNLMTMRDQDLQLLKQLIQIGDTIRKLSRCHDHRRSGSKRTPSTSFRSTQELMSSAVDLSVTLRRSKGRRTSGLFSAGGAGSGGGVAAAVAATAPGDYSTVPLVRRQSEPQMCGLRLSPRAAAEVEGSEVRSWGSRRGSGSSTEWWSEDTLGSSEDGLDDLGSSEDATTTTRDRDSNLVPGANAISSTSNTATAIFAHSSTHTLLANLTEEASSADIDDTEPEKFVHRPKSHSVVAATFLSRPKLSGGNSTYSDILNQNVRLWKDRLESANNVRQRIAILEEESQES